MNHPQLLDFQHSSPPKHSAVHIWRETRERWRVLAGIVHC